MTEQKIPEPLLWWSPTKGVYRRSRSGFIWVLDLKLGAVLLDDDELPEDAVQLVPAPSEQTSPTIADAVRHLRAERDRLQEQLESVAERVALREQNWQRARDANMTALGTIAKLTAERDGLRAEVERLKAVLGEMELYETAGHLARELVDRNRFLADITAERDGLQVRIDAQEQVLEIVRAQTVECVEQVDAVLGNRYHTPGIHYSIPHVAELAVAEIAQLQARIEAVPNILRQHYLAWIECDHDQQMDNPQCACSKVDLGWHPTVGDAVNAWIEHVRAALQGDQSAESQGIVGKRLDELTGPYVLDGLGGICHGDGKCTTERIHLGGCPKALTEPTESTGDQPGEEQP